MDKKSKSSNIRAHEHINNIGFPHKIINLIVLEKITSCLKEIQNSDDIGPRVLDVGCGTGYLLKKMLAQGVDAWGLDPYPRGEAARESLSKRVFEGIIEDVAEEPFQIITAIEVLEHVEDYMDLLRSMIKLLSPNGFIIITVPNKWEFQATYSPDGAIEPMYGHLWQFDHKSLESDLRYFSKEIYIEQIYSENLDRILLRFTRLLPSVVVIKLSRLLVTYCNDGGWLLGVIKREKTLPDEIRSGTLPKPSANYYINDPYFTKEI